MNYQFPLLNLITRGHLQVKNSIAAKNFIEKLDNDSCQTILENLMSINDSRLCARKFDEVMEAYNLKTGNRLYVSEAVLNGNRDTILENDSAERREALCEGMDEVLDNAGEVFSLKNKIDEILKLIKIGGLTAAIYKLASMKPSERHAAIENINKMSKGSYELLRKCPLFKAVLPEYGTVGRTAKAAWTFDKGALERSDRKWYSEHYGNALKKVGIGALIAVGLTAAIAGISMAYKRWFSAAAKECKGLSGKKRTICMSTAIIAASEKALKKAEKGLLECDSAKDPQECRYKMKIEIRSWSKKIEEQKRKIMKLSKVNSNPYGDKTDTSDVPVSKNPFG